MEVKEFDVIVIGAGHAGCEAALAAAKLGCRTLIITINLDRIALMPCNPAIGGVGKGHLVREIDALGGFMAKNIDRNLIQIKVLNRSKGPAVQALRAQADKRAYEMGMRAALESEDNLELVQDIVSELTVSGNEVVGVATKFGGEHKAKAVVLATGTFMRGKVVIGEVELSAGRMGEFPAIAISESLEALGFELGRFQSATPPRIDGRTIDTEKMIVQNGDDEPLAFSFSYDPYVRDNQIPCYLTYTNKETHQVIRNNIHRSPIKTGQIASHGPRFCPSIDRKVINFPDKDSHPVFVEPEGRFTNEMYLQGLTTSMPVEIQQKIVSNTPGLESAKIIRPGYAIEYDYVVPDQVHATLETKIIHGLFTAGQINGTSGYEEAAAQGLIAGINAARHAQGQEKTIISRSKAYIGVMIDDLVTKGVDEPYRIFTSRAEYRLLLRSNNADLRLAPIGYRLGTVSGEVYQRAIAKQKAVEEELNRLGGTRLAASEAVNKELDVHGSARIDQPALLIDLLKRPELNYRDVLAMEQREQNINDEVVVELEMLVKYDGYVRRQMSELERNQAMEHRSLPEDIDYFSLEALSYESREKLNRVRPASIGQASRIQGVTPADITVLMIYLEAVKRRRGEAG